MSQLKRTSSHLFAVYLGKGPFSCEIMSKRMKKIRKLPGKLQVDVPIQFSEYANQKVIIKTKTKVHGLNY